MPDDKKASGDTNSKVGAAWAEPLLRFDAAWQTLEARLCTVVVIAEIVSLTLWVFLRGLATDYIPGGNASGLLCRRIISAAIFGVLAHLATRQNSAKVHRVTVTTAIFVGLLFFAKAWAHVCVHWASNFLNWCQNASVLMLIGGLRGLATRLTLWLALIGASLATSRAKHIHVDVLIRYLPEKARMPGAVAGWLAAAAVCVMGAVGFVDYISIAEFRASATAPCPNDPSQSCDATTEAKLAIVRHEMAADLFLLGRQASLDVRSLSRVVAGEPYDGWMTAADWNQWLDSADWAEHFEKSAVDAQHMDPSQPDAKRMPQVAVPGTGEEARGLLIRDLNLVFPFGLALIAIKFLIRILLVASGKIEIHPEAELDEEDLKKAHERDAAAGEATT